MELLFTNNVLAISLILPAVIGLGGLGVAFGIVLAVASERLAVKVDPRVKHVLDVLPGINCGACGQPGCEGYADAVVDGKVALTLCAPGGPEVAQRIAGLLGVEVEAGERLVAFCSCKGGKDSEWKYDYDGIPTCGAAALVGSGPIACNYGCIGFYDCITACQYDAFTTAPNGMPVVVADKCVACKACIDACPRGLFELVPISKKVHILCSNRDKGKAVKDVCRVGCIGCSRCVKKCDDGQIVMKDGLAVIDHTKGDANIEAVETCPVEVIHHYAYQDPITWQPSARQALAGGKRAEEALKPAAAKTE